MPTVMDNIREAKSRRNMTASELSRASGVPLGTLNKLLTGVIEEPKLSTAVALCHALTLSLAVIMDEDTVWAAADDEKKLLTDYRGTDEYGRAMVARVAEMECSRAADRRAEEEDRALHTPDEAEAEAVITLPLYLLPVSAGPGAVLDSSDRATIDVRVSQAAERADFALRVSGDSMEPRFRSGDVLLVRQQPEVCFGELGIFIADGEGYFKRYMGDRLHSLNPLYPDLPLKGFHEFYCCGKVVGHMKKKARYS
ncbi:MAG: helix-turn-helix domain-containing protein [Clostridia bacterium]|nr:helix-turn-helix domain-containing protein [Clostridia bacterium]